MNTNFKVLGLTRLKTKPEFTTPACCLEPHQKLAVMLFSLLPFFHSVVTEHVVLLRRDVLGERRSRDLPFAQLRRPSQSGEEARSYLCMVERNLPTPVCKRFRLTHANPGKLPSSRDWLAHGIKSRILDELSDTACPLML